MEGKVTEIIQKFFKRKKDAKPASSPTLSFEEYERRIQQSQTYLHQILLESTYISLIGDKTATSRVIEESIQWLHTDEGIPNACVIRLSPEELKSAPDLISSLSSSIAAKANLQNVPVEDINAVTDALGQRSAAEHSKTFIIIEDIEQLTDHPDSERLQHVVRGLWNHAAEHPALKKNLSFILSGAITPNGLIKPDSKATPYNIGRQIHLPPSP